MSLGLTAASIARLSSASLTSVFVCDGLSRQQEREEYLPKPGRMLFQGPACI
jgi:hypothetical protein